MSNTEENPLYKNHIPIVIASCSPFRLVLRATDVWDINLDDVNKNTYNYVKLCRISGFIDVRIKPFSLGIAFDGSLFLPTIEQFRSPEKALDKFNETLGILLLGGVYTESIHPDDLSVGRLFSDGYMKNGGQGRGLNSSFHQAIQSRSAGPLDSIRLLNPIKIGIDEITQAYESGTKVFNNLTGLSPSLLLNGVSNFVKKQWSEGLIFLWTAIEQVINIIWKNEVLITANDEVIDGRMNFLKDFRTWTTSTKIEVLYQKKHLKHDDYKMLNVARKARNEFIHNASALSADKVKSALDALFRLISLIMSDYKSVNELDYVLELIYRNQRGDLYPKADGVAIKDVTHWREIPPLPGDTHWQGEYEIIDELVLKPIVN